jgi:hypothetical protein
MIPQSTGSSPMRWRKSCGKRPLSDEKVSFAWRSAVGPASRPRALRSGCTRACCESSCADCGRGDASGSNDRSPLISRAAWMPLLGARHWPARSKNLRPGTIGRAAHPPRRARPAISFGCLDVQRPLRAALGFPAGESVSFALHHSGRASEVGVREFGVPGSQVRDTNMNVATAFSSASLDRTTPS